jgi:transposase
LGVTRVVMEATSDYWKPPFYLLEAHGFQTWLVNAKDVKWIIPGLVHTSLIGKVAAMPKQYDDQTKAKAVRLVQDHVGDYASEYDAIRAVAGRLGMNPETLRKWIRQAEVDGGQVDGTTTAASREIRELKRKNAELERTVEILKAATSFFVRESDPQHR